MPFVCDATEVEYVRRMCEMLRTGISFSSKRDVVNLSRFCLPCPFSLFYVIRVVDTWSRSLGLEVGQSSKVLLVGWHNTELIVGPPARRELVYVTMKVFWHDFESPRCFLAITPLCFSYFLGLLVRDDLLLTSRVRCWRCRS